ncbi:MAG: hypothetical protein JWR37_222 [Mycobacterium sp.]|nr:hypothetical protein [Mycobacterium sp.]
MLWQYTAVRPAISAAPASRSHWPWARQRSLAERRKRIISIITGQSEDDRNIEHSNIAWDARYMHLLPGGTSGGREWSIPLLAARPTQAAQGRARRVVPAHAVHSGTRRGGGRADVGSGHSRLVRVDRDAWSQHHLAGVVGAGEDVPTPGTVSSEVRVPPPMRSLASRTVTSTPSSASVTAAASPLGPGPTTRASVTATPRCSAAP